MTTTTVNEKIIDELPQYEQTQVSLQRQLYLVKALLAKYGLYDAQDWLEQRMNYVTYMPTDVLIQDVDD